MKGALLIIDMQNQFGPQIVNPLLANIERLWSVFDSLAWPIIFTQHGHARDDVGPPIRSQHVLKLMKRGIAPMVVGTKEWELVPAIAEMAKDALIVAKDSYDAFRSGELECILRQHGVERLLVTGVMTDICCHTTAVQAFTKDYETWLVADACGTSTEVQHERALESARMLIDNVLDTNEAIGRLQREQDPHQIEV